MKLCNKKLCNKKHTDYRFPTATEIIDKTSKGLNYNIHSYRTEYIKSYLTYPRLSGLEMYKDYVIEAFIQLYHNLQYMYVVRKTKKGKLKWYKPVEEKISPYKAIDILCEINKKPEGFIIERNTDSISLWKRKYD